MMLSQLMPDDDNELESEECTECGGSGELVHGETSWDCPACSGLEEAWDHHEDQMVEEYLDRERGFR